MSNILRPVRPLITPPRGAVVGLLVALASCVQGREPQGEVLKLREVFAVLVEGPGRVSLIAALSNGSYVAVGPAPGHLVVHRPPREPFLTTSPSSAPVAVSIDHDAAEVLDRIGSIFRVEGLEQDPPAAVLLREAMLLVAGTKANGEWFALSVDAAGTASLQQLDGFGGVSTILSPLPLPVGWDPYRSRITTSETRFIVSEGVFPFRRLYVGSRTLLVETFAPSVETLARDIGLPEDSLATWVALNVVELDRATLQTLADPSSDRRAILLTDGDGKAQRVLPIDAPIGFSGAAPDDETLIAVRNLGQLEVVGYRWEWREPESPPKP